MSRTSRMRSNCRPRRIATTAILRNVVLQLSVAVVALKKKAAISQMGVATALPEAERQKAAAERQAHGVLANYPQLVDITASTGITFEHQSSPEAKFIVESMSGGVVL